MKLNEEITQTSKLKSDKSGVLEPGTPIIPEPTLWSLNTVPLNRLTEANFQIFL